MTSSTEVWYPLQRGEEITGGVWAVGGRLEALIHADAMSLDIIGDLRHHGPGLRDMLLVMLAALDRALAMSAMLIREKAIAENIEVTCQRLTETVGGQVERELDRDRGMEARVL